MKAHPVVEQYLKEKKDQDNSVPETY